MPWQSVLPRPRFAIATRPGGWTPGTTSGACNAYNGNGGAAAIGSATPFTFGAAQLTAGFRGGYQLSVEGYRTGEATAAFRRVLDLDVTAARPATFDFVGVNEVRFAAANPGDGHFVMDDLVLAPASTVPEPGTWALDATGLAAAAGLARRRG